MSQHLKQVLLAKMDPEVHPGVQLDRELLKNCQIAEDQELHMQMDSLQTEVTHQKEQIKLLTSQVLSLQSQLQDAKIAEQDAISNSKTY